MTKTAATAKSASSRRAMSLLDAVKPVELWHSPHRVAFATINVNGHYENWRLDSHAFQIWATGEYYKASGRAPTVAILNDAIRVLTAQSIHEGSCYSPMVRIAWAEGSSWLDLCDERWRAVRISRSGWDTIERPPIKFVRNATMEALPDPEAGYLLEELRGFVNANDDDYRLIVGWLIAALWGKSTSFPVLALGGEQGSGKTTLARLLRKLVDPSAVSALALPREDRDLFVQARNGHMLNYDNISRIDPWLSDSICRLATGAGFMTRKLHTDAEPFWFEGSRPILLNGIPTLTDRADLAERTLTVRLQRPDERNRRSESDHWRSWEQVWPRVLGALLDALCSAVRSYESTKLDRKPRMADFAQLVTATEPGLGWDAGEFLRVYETNRQTTNAGVFEADPVASAIEMFIQVQSDHGTWQGTATELLELLKPIVAEETRRLHIWPKKPSSLGSALDRAAPLLRERGIVISKRSTGAQRLITIQLVG